MCNQCASTGRRCTGVSDQCRCDRFRIQHGFIRRRIEGTISLGGTPQKGRKLVRSAAPAPSPVWLWISRRPSPSAAYRRRHRRDHGRLERNPEPETTAAPCCRSESGAGRLGEGAGPATLGPNLRQHFRMASWIIGEAACQQQLFHITIAEAAPEIEPDRTADALRREAMVFVWVSWPGRFPRASLPHRAAFG